MARGAEGVEGVDGDQSLVRTKPCNKRSYTFYSDDKKTRFFHLFFSKYLRVSAAAKQLGIHIRAAQRWVKRYL